MNYQKMNAALDAQEARKASADCAQALGSAPLWRVRWRDAFEMAHATDWPSVSQAELHIGQLLSQGAIWLEVTTIPPNGELRRGGDKE
jgi:hypothetical protein